MIVTDLETFFASRNLPKQIQLNKGEKITDIKTFVQSHLHIAKHSPERVAAPFYDRLVKLRGLLEAEQN